MICGDLDMERALRDEAYRLLAQAFLIPGRREPLYAVGFPELRGKTTTVVNLHQMVVHEDARAQQANAS